MPDDDLHTFQYNIPLLCRIIYHLQHRPCMVISPMKKLVFQVGIAYMVIMPT